MDEREIKELFEKVYLGGNGHAGRINEHGRYVHPSVQDAYAGWKAAFELLNAPNAATASANRR